MGKNGSSRRLIPVVDIFAGPGGLGEGFASVRDTQGNTCFKTALSIEKDSFAFRTLQLRALFRAFGSEVHKDYYLYLKGRISREELFQRHPREARIANNQAWLAELGAPQFPPEVVDRKIQEALRGQEQWLLVGGPPCQAYSIVGRSRMRGVDPEAFDRDPRHFLYTEYLRILAVHAPAVFIFENVKGILSAKVNGDRIFSKILSDIREPGKCLEVSGSTIYGKKQNVKYKLYPLSRRRMAEWADDPTSFVVKMANHGIPQNRDRVIILGIRGDIGVEPETLAFSPKTVPVWNVIQDLPKLRSGLSQEEDSGTLWREVIRAVPKSNWINDDRLDPELKSVLIAFAHQAVDYLNVGGEYVGSSRKPKYRSDWYLDEKLNGVCNHSSRAHMRADLERYFFAACFARVHKRSPLLKDFPEALLPKHQNVTDSIASGRRLFSDRFCVQLYNKPATTITSHMAKDGHYFIHPDPAQCRSLTVREAARLQTFPDNYFFEGPRTSQYQQVGNAVPPLLAKAIAEIVYKVFETSAARRGKVHPEEPVARQLSAQLQFGFRNKGNG